MNALFGTMRGMSRWRLFGLFVALTAVLATIASLATYRFVLDDTSGTPLKLALIAPNPAQSAEGAAMAAGARQALKNWPRGVAGHPVELVLIDENTPGAAALAIRDPRVAGVIGPYGAGAAARLRPELEAAGLATISLASPFPSDTTTSGSGAFFSIAPSSDQEVRFLANYVRNVLGERLVSIVLPDRPDMAALAESFDAVLRNFGTRVVYRWAVPANGEFSLDMVASEFTTKQIAGSVLLLGGPEFTARALARLRAAGVPNRVIGTRDMASRAFTRALKQAWHGPGTEGAGLNGTVVTTPMLFDTAGTAAQEFRTAVLGAANSGPNGDDDSAPDWLSVLTHDAASAMARAIADQPAARHGDAVSVRKTLASALASYDRPDRALPGLTGPIWFTGQMVASLPRHAGVYDGTALISSPTQLSPIHEEGVSDYLGELKEGRALYVNDRFMYKTSVVYAGVQIEKIFDISPDTNIADIEFLTWFRWRGELDAKSVLFPNAVTPIELGTPEREGRKEDINYRVHRVRGKFFMNGSDTPHPYGTQLIEILLRHKTLGANNLRLVTDVLGLGLTGSGPREEPPGWLERLLGNAPTGILARQMTRSQVLAGVSGWLIDRAWVSQEVVPASSRGDPVFVGFGKPAPMFSTIGLGLVVKPDAIDPGAAVPSNWLIYATIFAAFGAFLAHLLDRGKRGQVWRMQTLLLRLLTWPVLVLAGSAVALDQAQGSLSPNLVRGIDLLGNALWWLVGAWLVTITVERFVWAPLETRTERRVPTVFRVLVTILIFVLAGFGIVAFVLGKTITSLLATSGLLTLIIGLAVQSNLKDIFSGIMLNMERPFRIGDLLRFGGNVGRVADISWRTTRVRMGSGTVVALPNGKLSDSDIENLSVGNEFEANITIPMSAAYKPETIIAIIKDAMKQVEVEHELKGIGLNEMLFPGDTWIASYVVRCVVPRFPMIRELRVAVNEAVWPALTAAGFKWTIQDEPDAEIPPENPVLAGAGSRA